jgi:NAD-dependent DNA ligase
MDTGLVKSVADVGAGPGSKLDMARKLSIPTLTERQLRRLLGG